MILSQILKKVLLQYNKSKFIFKSLKTRAPKAHLPGALVFYVVIIYRKKQYIKLKFKA